MANPNVFNIIKSNAIIYVGPVGEAPPDANHAAGLAWPGNWQRVGFTKEAVTLKYEDTRTSIEVEEVLAKIDEIRTSEMVQAETVLAELTGDYLHLLVGGELDKVESLEKLEVGNEVRVDKKAWGFEGVRFDETDQARPVRFIIYRASAKLNGDLQFSKHEDDYTGVPLHVEGMADMAHSGKVFEFQRVATAPTPSP